MFGTTNEQALADQVDSFVAMRVVFVECRLFKGVDLVFLPCPYFDGRQKQTLRPQTQ